VVSGPEFGHITVTAMAADRLGDLLRDHVPSASSTPPSEPAQLKPRPEPVTAVPFSRNRTVQHRMVEYDVTDPGKAPLNVSQLDVSRGQFLSSDGGQQLNPDDMNAKATVRNGRVILDVCFNRTDPNFGPPASYLGTISIVDPRVNRTDVTFNVTMSYPWWQLVSAVFVAMLLPALLYVWFLRGSFQSHEGLTLELLQKWLFSRTALMAIGAGFAAAIGVFSAIYAKAPAWGGDWTSATAPFGATFSAFVAPPLLLPRREVTGRRRTSLMGNGKSRQRTSTSDDNASPGSKQRRRSGRCRSSQVHRRGGLSSPTFAAAVVGPKPDKRREQASEDGVSSDPTQ
jgi:hypothetical protein